MPVARGWWLLPVMVAMGCGRGPLWVFGDGSGDDLGGGENDCDRADLLFVVDDSPSMQAHQRDLANNVPAFLEGVQRLVEDGTDLHVGVTTTDAYHGNTAPCDVLGGLVTATSGSHSSWSECGPFASGARYMTNADPLAEDFACTAMVGTVGSVTEQPLRAAAEALDPNGAAASCNAGFRRRDALLVLVVVTDEADQSPGLSQRWALDLRDSQGGDDALAVVSLIGEGDDCGEGVACYEPRVEAFTETFAHGFVGSIDGDYAEQFDDAIDVVAAACAGD